MPIDLEPIKQRLSRVPAPPWQEFCESGDWWIQQSDTDGMPAEGGWICNSGSDDLDQEVADFIVAAPADIAALIAEVERLRQALEERAIDNETLELAAHNFHTLATFPAWVGEDCRLCRYTQAGHAADCPYALADEALQRALAKEELRS